jgi:hypothetical protein
MELPPQARLLAMALDDAPLSPRLLASGRYLIPLQAPAGPRRLQVRWSYADNIEPLERPNLAAPVLIGTEALAVQSQLSLPAGLAASSLPTSLGSSISQVLLARARAYALLSRVVADLEPGEKSLLQAQKAFFWSLRQCELQLGPGKDDDKTLQIAISDLRQENLRWAQSRNFDQIRALAEKEPAEKSGEELLPTPDRGAPVYLRTHSPSADLFVPLYELAPGGQADQLRWTEFLILAALGLSIFSLLPGGLRRLARLWPEFLLACTLTGMFAWGPSVVGVIGLTVALGVRIVALVRGLSGVLGSYLGSNNPPSTLNPSQ